MWVTQIIKDGKKHRVFLDGEETFWLHSSELRASHLQENMELAQEQYEQILYEYIVKRAKRRALHLLEKMDRTKKQLTNKLFGSGYPAAAVEAAVKYVESYHYLDDERYARHYMELHKERDSRQKMKTDLMRKGVDREMIDALLEEEQESAFSESGEPIEGIQQGAEERETAQIVRWLEKKHYPVQPQDEKEKRRVYQFLLRKGYKSSEILTQREKAEQQVT